jgi:hypothetical protein
MDQRTDLRNQAACSRKKSQWQEIPGTGGEIQKKGTKYHVPGPEKIKYKEQTVCFREKRTVSEFHPV